MPLDLDKKLASARTRLILEKPFLGALVLRLPMVRANEEWCDATFSNGKKFYYNEHYIDALTPDQTQFVLAHEALHCALSHFARRQNRVQHRWAMACDFAINPMLINDGMKPPVDVNYLREYNGMTAEEIYPLLQDNDNDQERELEQELNPDSENDKNDSDEGASGDEHEQKEGKNQKQKSDSKGQGEEDGGARENNADQDNSDKDNGETKKQEGPPEGNDKPEPLTPQEIESLSLQWQQRMASAAQQAIQAGKMGGSMSRMVDHLLQPRLPWRNLLSRYMSMLARDDYTYMRPSSRRGDPAVYPSLRSAQLNVVIALDISGSISNKEIDEFMSEVNSIKSQIRARITLLVCDSELARDGPWLFEPWEEFSLPKKFKGGGGTSFKPVMEWAERQDETPSLIVYFTDAQGEFPEKEPIFPVVWLVKGKTPVPWGQRVQLN